MPLLTVAVVSRGSVFVPKDDDEDDEAPVLVLVLVLVDVGMAVMVAVDMETTTPSPVSDEASGESADELDEDEDALECP